MPFLGYVFSWIASIAASVVAFLASAIGKKAATATFVGGTFVAGWVALQVMMMGLWTGLGFMIPPVMQPAVNAIVYCMPSNFDACFSAMLAGKLARWLWDVQVEFVKVTAAA